MNTMRSGSATPAADWTRVMWVIVGVALAARIWGCWYGLPFCYHKDEYHEVMRALELGAGGFNLERTAKGGFYLLLFFEYGVYFVLLKILGVVKSTGEFAELFARDPSAFYLMGRITAAAFGAATVAACYWLASRAFSATAGILATSFLALNALHVDLSRVIGVDVPMALFATLTLYFSVKIAERGEARDYWLGAICAALATTTKLPGVLLLIPLLIAHSYACAGKSGGVRGRLLGRKLWISAGLFAAVLVVTNPGILFAADLLALFQETATPVSGGDMAMEAEDETAAGRPNLFLFYLRVLQESMGWPLFGTGLAGVIYAMWRRTPPDIVLLTYALVNYFAISSTTSEVLYYPRYTLPIIVVLSVLAGRLIAALIASIPRQRGLAAAAIVASLLVSPTIQAAIAAYSVAQIDTRTQAYHWTEKNVPVNSTVLVEGGKIAADRGTVPIRDSRSSIERRIRYWRHIEPRQAEFLELQLSVHSGGGYELELVRVGSLMPVAHYIDQGVKFFVVRPTYFVNSRRSDPASALFLQELRDNTDIRLLKRFDGETAFQPGPTIEIYGLR